jgi:hypothetical protein
LYLLPCYLYDVIQSEPTQPSDCREHDTISIDLLKGTVQYRYIPRADVACARGHWPASRYDAFISFHPLIFDRPSHLPRPRPSPSLSRSLALSILRKSLFSPSQFYNTAFHLESLPQCLPTDRIRSDVNFMDVIHCLVFFERISCPWPA